MRISHILDLLIAGHFAYRVIRMWVYGDEILRQLYVVVMYLNLLMASHLAFRVIRMWVYVDEIIRQLHVVVLYFVLPYMADIFLYVNVFDIVSKAVEVVTSWKFFIFVIFLWIFIEIVYARFHKVRVFVNKHRKVLWNIVLGYLFILTYAKISDYYRPDNGTCKALTAYEYFSQPREIVNQGKFLAVFCHALLIIVIFSGSCVFLMYFYVPITIS